MAQRTYSMEDYRKSVAAWDAGAFSAEWKDWRHWAATEGTIAFPPEGTAFDSWDDDHPSQRAILIRAIRETPERLRRSIRGARSWSEVIARLIPEIETLRADREQELEQRVYSAKLVQPTREEAGVFLRDLLGRLKEPVA